MGVIAILGVILKAAKLAKRIKDVLDKIIPPPPDDLKDKHRWYQYTIKNCTQFPLLLEDTYFFRGKLWTASSDVQKFEQLVFSGCNKDHEPTGVSGGMALRLKLDQDHFFDIAIRLTSPDLGGHNAGVIESLNPKDGYDIASDDGSAITSQNEYRAKDGDDPDKDVDIEFHASAQPGQEVLIVVTEVRL